MPESTSLTIIAICQLIMTAALLVAVLALIYAIFAFKNLLNTKIDEALNRVQPVVDRAETIAQQAKETAESVSSKLDHIMTRVENTTDTVTDKVQSVSTRVEESVTPQMATIAGVIGTAMQAMQIYRDIVEIRHHRPAERGSTIRVERSAADM